MKTYELRFFNERGDEERVVVEVADSWERQDKIDALWDEAGGRRERLYDAVEW